jgi:transposase
MSVIMDRTVGLMEIITGVERRRRWRDEDKLRIVAEAEAPGAVLVAVARRHEVSRGQLFEWRRQVRRGELVAAPMVPEFMPVRVMAPSESMALHPGEPGAVPAGAGREAASRPRSPPSSSGRIEIVLPDGTCVRVDDSVGLTALRRVMTVVRA